MAVGRFIIILVLVIMLPIPGSALFSLTPGGNAIAGWPEGASPAWGETASPVPIQQPPSERELQPATTAPEPNLVDTVHGELSRRLLVSAEWLDSFFEDKRTINEANQSYLRIRYDTFREANTHQTIQVPSFSLRLRLPQLQQKAHLVFESEPLVATRGAPPPLGTTGAQVTPNDERNLAAALHYFLRKTPEESIIIRTGVQFSKGQPVLFLGPRYRKLRALDKWDLRYTQEAIYRTDTQWQTESLLDLERKLPYNLFFRSFIDGIWLANTNGYFYSIGCSLLHPFDATNAIQYGWTNSFTTRPTNELTEVNLSITYRHSFWRRWLFYELTPQCRFPRDRHFVATPGILVRLEMYLGDIAR